MAGTKVSSYSIADVNLTALMESTDDQRIGYHAVTLTEFDTSNKPSIAAGSKVENNGALYKFDSEEAITGSPSDGTVYIQLVPSGDSITAQFTNTAPTWSDSKQGWYGTGGSANYRYINFIMTKSGVSYSNKGFLLLDKTTDFMVYENGDIECNDIDSTGTINAYDTDDTGVLLKTLTIAVSLAFYLHIYQNGDWRIVINNTDTYNMHLNPGKYKLWLDASPDEIFYFYLKRPITAWITHTESGGFPLSVSLYCTGAYGLNNIIDSDVIEEVV